MFTLNFGTTLTDNQPVVQVIATYGTATLELVVYALVVAFIVASRWDWSRRRCAIAGPTRCCA